MIQVGLWRASWHVTTNGYGTCIYPRGIRRVALAARVVIGQSIGLGMPPRDNGMLELRATKIYRGPSVWARAPVIHLSLDLGDLEDRPTNAIPGFYERLTELIPSLYDHGCSLGHPGGFLERLREGTLAGHVVEHVALELQNLAGIEVTRGKTRSTGQPGVYDVVYAYTQ